jgi:4'-phosphopantetheinyl transferase
VSRFVVVGIGGVRARWDTQEWLDVGELTRWRGLARAEDRSRFLTSRAVLKTLVGDLAEVPAGSVHLDYRCDRCSKQHGRPVVVAPATAVRWQVSLAHCDDLVLAAATETAPVGVDVERVAAVDFEGFDDVALTRAEQASIADLPTAQRRSRARASHWVGKEAYLKAIGEGLRVDPADLDLASHLDVRSVALLDVPVGPGYVAAVAVLAAPPVRLEIRRVSGPSPVAAAAPDAASGSAGR